ncbi:MAG TPA: hypothetical protein VFS42_01445, partial [Burkholderiaceae bacterium]|nr:hypothetical protein [Burkholderiaceae bacterium]
ITAKPLGIQKIDASDEVIALQFEKNAPVDPARVISLIQRNRHAKLAGPDRLRINQSVENIEDRVRLIRGMLAELR